MDVAQQPVIFGEVLYDLFDDGQAVLGGAPFNVAWHLQGFALTPLFISRIGEDELGEKIRTTMRSWHLSEQGLQRDTKFPTGTVHVTLKDGQPGFSIQENVAYDHVELTPLQSLLGPQPISLLYHGSLIARTQKVSEVLLDLRNKAETIFVDINLRAPWWSKTTVFNLIEGASWLKVNDDELATLVGVENQLSALQDAASAVLEKYSLQGIIVTRGEHGAFICSGNGIKHATPASVTQMEDTVGAGDAFSSVCILGLLNNWDHQQMLDRAAIFAAAICQQRGATNHNPKLYQDFARQWQLA